MTTPDGADLQSGGGERDAGLSLHYLVPGGLVALLLAVVAVTAMSLGGSGSGGASDRDTRHAARFGPYWTVKRGQTYAQIAQKTGLSIDQLETFNPHTDPSGLAPGTRIKLRLRVPPPKPKPKGPRFWTVRTGQSYGSIAAKTGPSIIALQRLNPRLKPDELHPGDRIRLRR